MKSIAHIIGFVVGLSAIAGSQAWSPSSIEKLAKGADRIFVAEVTSLKEQFFIDGKEVPKSKAGSRFDPPELVARKAFAEPVTPGEPLEEVEELIMPDIQVRITAKLNVTQQLKGEPLKDGVTELSWSDSHLSMCPHPKTSFAER